MAVAMMGGLVIATLLTLIFLPALYAAWFRVRPRTASRVSRNPLPRRRGEPAAAQVQVRACRSGKIDGCYHRSEPSHADCTRSRTSSPTSDDGRMVVLVDEEERENEGDLVIAADRVTPEAINFMARYGRGLDLPARSPRSARSSSTCR